MLYREKLRSFVGAKNDRLKCRTVYDGVEIFLSEKNGKKPTTREILK